MQIAWAHQRISLPLNALALHAAEATHVLMEHEIPDDTTPTSVGRHREIILWGILVQLRQEPPWNSREVVVLIVVPNVVAKEVAPFTIIRICFLARDEFVVLSDEMTRHWMHAKSEEGSKEQIEEGLGTPIAEHQEVEGRLHCPVDQLIFVHSLRIINQRPQCIEARLEHHPKELADWCAEKETFPWCRDVCIDPLHTLRAMMFQMIALEA